MTGHVLTLVENVRTRIQWSRRPRTVYRLGPAPELPTITIGPATDTDEVVAQCEKALADPAGPGVELVFLGSDDVDVA
ncbi:hypothetical protein GS440_19145 [Rhodococcus hoagii]|nr:hypothetical protein [Prescottella equi]